MCQRNPIQCIIPPYIADQLAKSTDPQSKVSSRSPNTCRRKDAGITRSCTSHANIDGCHIADQKEAPPGV